MANLVEEARRKKLLLQTGYVWRCHEGINAALEAAKTKDMDKMVDVSGTVSDACAACHEVYRDKPGGTTDDPSNKAARCAP